MKDIPDYEYIHTIYKEMFLIEKLETWVKDALDYHEDAIWIDCKTSKHDHCGRCRWCNRK